MTAPSVLGPFFEAFEAGIKRNATFSGYCPAATRCAP